MAQRRDREYWKKMLEENIIKYISKQTLTFVAHSDFYQFDF